MQNDWSSTDWKVGYVPGTLGEQTFGVCGLFSYQAASLNHKAVDSPVHSSDRSDRQTITGENHTGLPGKWQPTGTCSSPETCKSLVPISKERNAGPQIQGLQLGQRLLWWGSAQNTNFWSRVYAEVKIQEPMEQAGWRLIRLHTSFYTKAIFWLLTHGLLAYIDTSSGQLEL